MHYDIFSFIVNREFQLDKNRHYDLEYTHLLFDRPDDNKNRYKTHYSVSANDTSITSTPI